MKKKVIWGTLIVVLVLVAVIKGRSLSAYVAGAWLESAKERAAEADVLSFRYAGIDSLYERERYAYFLFAEDHSAGQSDGLSARMDSLLVITCGAGPAWLKETEADTVRLPRSAFDFCLKENQSMQLYRVAGVSAGTDGNLYRLSKMVVE